MVVVAIVVLILLAVCVYISVRKNKENRLTEKEDTHQPKEKEDMYAITYYTSHVRYHVPNIAVIVGMIAVII